MNNVEDNKMEFGLAFSLTPQTIKKSFLFASNALAYCGQAKRKQRRFEASVIKMDH